MLRRDCVTHKAIGGPDGQNAFHNPAASHWPSHAIGETEAAYAAILNTTRTIMHVCHW